MNACPKCGHRPGPQDPPVLPGLCPACGIAMDKWRQRQTAAATPAAAGTAVDAPPATGFRQRLLAVPEATDPVVFAGRLALFALLLVWGLSFVANGLSWERIMNSFMHSINLPFHEFGHVLFSPFGRFMTILGGSLFQVLLPLGLALAFLYRRQDTFAASVMLWWCGQSFIDLSPYIADATYRGLPLVGGLGEEAHDWGNLLTMLGWLEYDRLLARTSFTLGAGLILLSLTWGGWLLWRQSRGLKDTA